MKFLDLPELDILASALKGRSSTTVVETRIEAYSCKAINKDRQLLKSLENGLRNDTPEGEEPVDSAFGPLDRRESVKLYSMLVSLLNVAFPDHDFSRVPPEAFEKDLRGPVAVARHLSHALDAKHTPAQQDVIFQRVSQGKLPAWSRDDLNPYLVKILDPIIDIRDCEVYQYLADEDSDPHAGEDDLDDYVDWDDEPSTSSYPKKDKRFDAVALDTPMSSVPGTPDSESYRDDSTAGGSLLWSEYYFLYNRKLKRMLFITTWARNINPGFGPSFVPGPSMAPLAELRAPLMGPQRTRSQSPLAIRQRSRTRTPPGDERSKRRLVGTGSQHQLANSVKSSD